jgi:HAD superfamily hydrolase (TIGR01509 family)
MLCAVLFDLDGTLADTERQNAEAVARALERAGRPMTDEERLFVIGHGWREIYDHLHAHGGVALSFEELVQRATAEREALVVEHGLDVLPGAVALVRRVAARWPAALVSGSSRAEIAFCLRALGLDGCFPWFIGAEDTPRGKPNPDGYLMAAARLGVPPAGCVVLEDSAAGIAAAKAAGMRCIAVRAGNFAGQRQDHADRVVGTLEEVDDALLWQVADQAYNVGGA